MCMGGMKQRRRQKQQNVGSLGVARPAQSVTETVRQFWAERAASSQDCTRHHGERGKVALGRRRNWTAVALQLMHAAACLLID